MNFNKEELYWIERTADLECSAALHQFFKCVSIPKDNLSDQQIKDLTKYTDELISTVTLLKGLRYKFEAERRGIKE